MKGKGSATRTCEVCQERFRCMTGLITWLAWLIIAELILGAAEDMEDRR